MSQKPREGLWDIANHKKLILQLKTPRLVTGTSMELELCTLERDRPLETNKVPKILTKTEIRTNALLPWLQKRNERSQRRDEE